MITGTVTAGREAIVSLELVGVSGARERIDAVVDTGFTESLTLPLQIVEALGLSPFDSTRAYLADGSMVEVDLYECVVIWEREHRQITAHCMKGTPLIGMDLLYGHFLGIHVADGGIVSIAPVGEDT